MYCKNCGKELPEGAVFCPFCAVPQQEQQNNPEGYQQPVTPDNSQGFQPPMPPVNPAYQQPAPKKKKTGLIVVLVLCAVAFLGIIAVAIGIGFSATQYIMENQQVVEDILGEELPDAWADFAPEDEFVVNEDVTQEVPAHFSTEFQKILDDCNLEFERFVFESHLDYSVYASLDTEGMVDIQEMGSEGDKVYEMYETILVPTTGFSREDIDGLDKNMRDSFAAYEELDFCLVDYYEIEDYYVVELYVWDLNNTDNLKKLQDLGFVQEGFVLYLSLSATEQGLLSTGYVKG